MNGGWTRYLSNCFLLVVPVLLWDLILANRLPEPLSRNYWSNIPPVVVYGENILRGIVSVLPAFMPLRVSTGVQRTGLIVYVIGLLVYFVAWIPLVAVPRSAWSTSMLGFLAPAYTPLVWLVGIGLIGNSFYFRASYRRWFYVAASVLFVIFHSWHTAIVYLRSF